MKTTRFYQLVIVLLLLINVSFAIFVWNSRPARTRPHLEKMVRLSERLHVSDEHRKSMNQLEEEHHRAKRTLRKREASLRRELYQQIGTSSDHQELLSQITENHVEMEKMTMAFFDSLATYCGAEQQQQLRKIVHEALDRIHHPTHKKH